MTTPMPITRRHYDSAKAKGWIRTGNEIFPDARKPHTEGCKRCNPPDPCLAKEYFMAGDIAPCEVTVID